MKDTRLVSDRRRETSLAASHGHEYQPRYVSWPNSLVAVRRGTADEVQGAEREADSSTEMTVPCWLLQ